MVSQLSRRFQNFPDLSGWPQNLQDGFKTFWIFPDNLKLSSFKTVWTFQNYDHSLRAGRIFPDDFKKFRKALKLSAYFQMISNFPARWFQNCLDVSRWFQNLTKSCKTVLNLTKIHRVSQSPARFSFLENPLKLQTSQIGGWVTYQSQNFKF